MFVPCIYMYGMNIKINFELLILKILEFRTFSHSLLSANILRFCLHLNDNVNKLIVHFAVAAPPASLLTFHTVYLNFRHRASCILGQAFHYSPENAFYIINQQIYFIILYILDRPLFI